MIALESCLLSYLCNSLWQLPLLFAAGWLAARALRPLGAAAEHHLWVSVLLLQSLLPACSALPWALLRTLYPSSDPAVGAHVSVVMGPGITVATLPLPAGFVAAIAVAYFALSAWLLARFLWRVQALSALRSNAARLPLTGQAALCWNRCANRFGVHNATLAVSSQVFGPITIGFRRKLILLPTGMAAGLPHPDFETVLAHEFAHMQRQDFAKNLLYELLALPVSYHPLLRFTRERLAESREMVCDRTAAELAGPAQYAQSLLRLASRLVTGTPASAPHAIGILDANTFERRVMKLSGKQKQIRGIHRVAVLTACAALGVATCGSALALEMHVNASSASNESGVSKAAAPHTLAVSPGVMAGNIRTRVNPKYPEAAKQAKIQGSVVLNAVIGTDGAIEDLQVASGPEELRQSTLDAVRQWTYEPFRLNGDPVEVKTTITVTYSLQK